MSEKIAVDADPEQLADPLSPVALEQIRRSLVGLRFGQLQIVVHEGVIVQIDRTERKRLTKNGEVS